MSKRCNDLDPDGGLVKKSKFDEKTVANAESVAATEESDTNDNGSDEGDASQTVETKERCLRNAMKVMRRTSSGKDCVVGQFLELPHASGLSIEGYGPVAFPINAVIAESLKSYGRNATADKSACKPLEFDASIITVAHPDWSTQLQKLVDQVTKEMSCKGQVCPVLRKGLLCEKGDHFSFHKEIEKEKNMFATLVIQFPSICTGGNLEIRHSDGNSLIFDFGQQTKKAAFSMHYAAHYAEFEHSLQPITSGYQFLLTYSLCWETVLETVPSAMCPSMAADSFRNALIEYLNASENSSWSILFETTEKSGTQGDDNTLYNIVRCFNQDLDWESQLRILTVQLIRKIEFATIWIYRSMCKSCLEEVWVDGADPMWEESHVHDTIDYGNVTYVDSLGIKINDIITMDGENVDAGTLDWGKVALENLDHDYCDNIPTREVEYHREAMVISLVRNEFQVMLNKGGVRAGISVLLNEAEEASELSTNFFKHISRQLDTIFRAWIGSCSTEPIDDLLLLCTKMKSLEIAEKVMKEVHKLKYINIRNFGVVVDILKVFDWTQLHHLFLPIMRKLTNRINVSYSLLTAGLIASGEQKNSLIKLLFEEWETTPSTTMDKLADEYELFFEFGDIQMRTSIVKQMKQSLPQNSIKVIIQKSDFSQQEVKNDSSVQALLMHRYTHVAGIVKKGMSPFPRYSMANCAGHPEVTKFLRSNKTQFSYAHFNGLQKARDWAAEHFGSQSYSAAEQRNRKYSGTPTFKYSGKNTLVIITKTQNYFDRQYPKFLKIKKETKCLRKLLGNTVNFEENSYREIIHID